MRTRTVGNFRAERLLALWAMGMALGCWARAAVAADKLSEADAARIATDGFVFGYPLVLMDATERVGTATTKVDDQHQKAPVNQFVNIRTFPDPQFTDVVSPNADTLYTFAWLDLSAGPVVLSVPEMGKWYYLMEMLDAWTNVFASPGTRTTGNGAGHFAVVGPAWQGTLPKGVVAIKSPTNTVWVLGRTQTNGKADYAAVHAIQDHYKLTPLAAWGKNYTPPDNVPVAKNVDAKTAPVEQAARLDAAAFFSRLAMLMEDNPPSPADKPMVDQLRSIGVVAGKPFDMAALDPAVAKGIDQAPRAGMEKILTAARQPQGTVVNGWDVMTDLGQYGTHYLFRAVVSLVGLGANLPEDAIYPRATAGSDGQPLDGANRYTIKFAKGNLPPVRGFWSVTMYNAKQFFVPNSLERYAIGNRDPLKMNADGSLTLYVQHVSPGPDKDANWLPAPADSFNLIMRLYWPQREIISGAWQPPVVEIVK